MIKDKVPVSPSLDSIAPELLVPNSVAGIDRRVVWLCGLAVGIGLVASLVATLLMKLIALITNLSFYGQISLEFVGPEHNRLGLWVVAVPIIGGLIVGVMARYGSKAIRGHGIPEAMEQVLTNRSRIPARLTWLKPLSSAIAIGTGGPFGAEGPIIATGGAIGSMVGQMLHTTAHERKTLLAIGAAAGMAATFGSPLSAVLLAIELLLFEFRARSFVPVALGAVTAAGIRVLLEGSEPVFAMAAIASPSLPALVFYVMLGGAMGFIAVLVTRGVYAVEDAFERLPIHWMWWPALGSIVVGIVGYFAPRTLGVGYDNISSILSGHWAVQYVLVLCMLKLVSWIVALGSGTSGGTLAPMFTIGGGIGFVIGSIADRLLPFATIDPRIAGLVGMAAIFAGASRALLASAVFAFETTLQPAGLLPLLGGCSLSYLVATLLAKQSIMTEKIARRGVHAPTEYHADPLEQVLVQEIGCRVVAILNGQQTVEESRRWLSSDDPAALHQGFPVVNDRADLIGVLTRHEILDAKVSPGARLEQVIKKLPRFVYADCTVRQAVEHLVHHDIGRLPVLSRGEKRLVGIITRSDILTAYRPSLIEKLPESPTLRFALKKAQ